MKSGAEFGILRKELSSTTPQQTLCRKVTTHDLVLNNEECISASTFQGQGQYCFAEVAENVPRKPFVGMAKVSALELKEAPGKTASTLARQSVGMTAITKPQAPTHVIALAPQTHQFKMIPRISNPELFRHKTEGLKRRKWLIRVGILLAVILVLVCAVYQICAWTNRWQKRRSFLLVQRTPAPTFSKDHGGTVAPSVVNITICNANPFRGSAIFDLPSGSYLYDTLTGIRTGSMRVPDFAKELSKQSLSTLISISHHLQDTLKSCLINGIQCGSEEFESVLNFNRLCFRISLNSSVRELWLILDAEEYEYLLPNEAIVGFYLSVDNDRDRSITSRMGLKQYERSIDILQLAPEDDELFVGSHFQTFIQIGFSDTPVPNHSSARPTKVNPFRPVIRSVVQVAKPIFRSSLIQLKEPISFKAASRIIKARMVQQWAYLRLENTSVAVVIESLALRLGNLRKDFDGMLQGLTELRAGQHITPSVESKKWGFVETCQSPSGSPLNTIVNFTDGFYDHLCRLVASNEQQRQQSFLIRNINCNLEVTQLNYAGSNSETASSLQLFVIQMLFSQPQSTNQQINQLLRRQVSLLSIVNQELQRHHAAGEMDGIENLECTRCERLGANGDAGNSMSCRRMDRQLKVNMTQHWEGFKKFNQAIAACTQRLDALNKDLEATRSANLKIIQAFWRSVGSEVTDALPPAHSYVSLRIKINTEERPILTEFVSFEAIASPISEFLGILANSAAGILALIALWRVLEIKRTITQRSYLAQAPTESIADEMETTVNYFKTPSITA